MATNRTAKQIELENNLNKQSREFDEALAKVTALAKELQKSWNEARRLHSKAIENGDTEEEVVEDYGEAVANVAKYKNAKSMLDAIYGITRIYG